MVVAAVPWARPGSRYTAAFPGCVGSGSMRFPIARASDFCWWWPITTPAGWYGRARTAPRRLWAGSSTTWAPTRAALLTYVSAEGAEWIHDVVTARAPQAVLCLDAFHVVAWATEALDQVRRGMVNQLRAAVEHGLSNARSEVTNTPLRLLTRRAYGHSSPER